MKWLVSFASLIRGVIVSLRTNAATQPQQPSAVSTASDLVRPGGYIVALAVYGVQLLVGLVLCFMYWGVSYKFAGLRFDVGQLILVFLAYQGWRSYGEKILNEQVGITFLAMPVKWLDKEGPFWAPWPYCRILRAYDQLLQRQFPSDNSENIWKGADADRPEGKVACIRVTTCEGPDGSKSPLDRALTLIMSYFISIRITNLFVFLKRFSKSGTMNKEEALEEMWRQMRDLGDSALGSLFKNHTYAKLITEWDKVLAKFVELIRTATSDWGIEIVSARLNDPDGSHELAAALRNRAKAVADAQSKLAEENAQSDALAYRTEVTGLTAERGLEIELAGKSLEKANYSLIPGENVLGSLLLNHFNKNGGNNGGPVVSTQQQQPKQPQHGKGHKPKPSGSNP